jgi:curved DNA-binding protein CbpA
VPDQPFVDYYDLLQLSPNADEDTIHRVFRHLAKKCHPDLKEGSDPDRFRRLAHAHATLTDAESRAAYDALYQDYWNRKWRIASEASDGSAFAEDHDTREKLLSLLYVQRRRDMRSPGLGEYEMARLLRIPVELVEFHLWYLREKGWVQRIDTGQLAISANGVDSIEQSQLRLPSDHLLATRGTRSDGGHSRNGQTGGPPEQLQAASREEQ